MVELLVMRHAKSDWHAGVENDLDRPLNRRGIRAARLMGRFIAEAGFEPGLVLTSIAVRASRTVELAAESGDWGCPIRTTPVFYGADPEGVIEEIAAADPPGRLLVAGHEPCWSRLVSLLLGGASIRMTTAAVACLEFPGLRWQDLSSRPGRLRWLVTPKLLDSTSRSAIVE
jgi:phosphohistidine phosphatase